ncbi:hypothetical protein BY458DRAFT_455735 [Sporodiniella umbellata]|nr:hypothetical protein BY458DRAFT_455735 [Sporodiniella umbellata]
MSPNSMKCVRIHENGGVDKLKCDEVDLPKVSSGAILVKNHIAGVNFIDTYHRSGLYKVEFPFTIGTEGAGEVVEVGPEVSGFKVGDRVVYLSGSTYAEYTHVPARLAKQLPEDISSEDAVALGVQALTAWTMVRDGYKVNEGDIVLVHAAAGGVGLLLTQMLRHLGATVIGTVSTEEKAKLARENGANHVINYSKEDVVTRVNEITNGLGCHAVLDGVGKDTWEASLASTRRLGTLVSFGNASGAVPPISILSLTPKNIKLMRPQLFAYLATQEEFTFWWDGVLELMRNKVIKLNIYKRYRLEDAAQAHIDIESRKTTGKLLIEL